MDGVLAGAGAAVWLGFLTSISPCPLATNIAAISYIGKEVASPRRALLAGLLYAAGRTLTYVLLATGIVASLLSIPELSDSLQMNMNRLVGPVLIVAGIALLGLIPMPDLGPKLGVSLQSRASAWGPAGAALLGILFALSFCPVSAALFFGSLIPLAVTGGSAVSLPSLYGLGTAVPVVAFSVLLAAGSKALSRVFATITRLEWWARRGTGVAFLVVGVYYTLRFVFEVFD
jgi:cytochrome c biogenesis protein CcdA